MTAAPRTIAAEHVSLVLRESENIRKDAPFTSADARKVVGKLLDLTPAYIHGSELVSVPEMDVGAMVERLVDQCDELDIPEDHAGRVDVVWKVKAGASMGAVTCGTCKPVGKRERQTWRGVGPAPWWRLTLALDVWILMTEAERWRLVHHELMHAACKRNENERITGPAGRAHDIEEFTATLARYGVDHGDPARFIAQAMARPEMREELRVFNVDPVTGQGLLFGVLPPVGPGPA